MHCYDLASAAYGSCLYAERMLLAANVVLAPCYYPPWIRRIQISTAGQYTSECGGVLCTDISTL